MTSTYRAEIDGLRCVAVLAVLLFHAGLARFSGGFVGVDVFFVISGYLITGILLREMDGGTFSFLRFFERRVRRILPATLAVVLVSLGLALLLLTPPDARKVGEAASATVLSAANIYFYSTQNYFGAESGNLPLLHMWSLGVEEQFYLLLPVLLSVLVRYFRRHLAAVLVVLTVGSLAVYCWAIFRHPAAAFYLLPFRAWELGLGASLAACFGQSESNHPSNSVSHGAGIAGLLLIATAVFFGGSAGIRPGLAALPACLGVALIIAPIGASGIASKLLSAPPVRFVGKISFSLYLWHWPVLVFAKLALLPAAPARWILIAIMFVLAWLSWRFIEQPFRGAIITRQSVARSVCAGAAAAVALSVLLMTTKGLPQRFDVETVQLASFLDYDPRPAFREGTCFLTDRTGQSIDPESCLRADPHRPNILVLGDSHAAHLWYGLAHELPDIHFSQLTVASCRLTLASLQASDQRCRQAADLAYRHVLLHQRFRLVILSGAWKPDEVPQVAETLAWLRRRSIPVVLMGRGVTYREDVPRLLAAARIRGDAGLVDRYRVTRTAGIDQQLAAAADAAGVPFIALSAVECRSKVCMTQLPSGIPVKFDGGHLTAQGSQWLAHRLITRGRLQSILADVTNPALLER